VGNVAERDPLATVGAPRQHSEKKFRNESSSGCGFLYTKTRNHRTTTVQKLSKNATNNLLKTKKILNAKI